MATNRLGHSGRVCWGLERFLCWWVGVAVRREGALKVDLPRRDGGFSISRDRQEARQWVH